MVKKTKGKMGWHGESKRHSEARMKGAMTQSKNSSGRFYTRKTPKRIQNRVVKKITPKNQWEEDTGFEAKWLNAFEKEHGKISNVIEGNPFGVSGGKILETEDGEEWTVFDSYEDAERTAVDYITEQLEEEPGMFTQSWLENFMSMTDVDRRMSADEQANNYVEDIKDEDDGKRVIEEGGFEDELNELEEKRDGEIISEDEFESQKEALVDKSAQALESNMYDEIYESLEDPVEYFVEEQGMYSREDLLKQGFITIDVEKASQDAVDTDGVAHFLSGYDGEEVEENGKFMYRHN